MTGALLAALLASAMATQSPAVNPDAATLADFQGRVKAYADLRNKVDGGPAALKETNKPDQIAAAQDLLAERIRAARATAKQGDIFSPAIRAKFIQLLQPEVHGKRGEQSKASINSEDPGGFPLAVNTKYPDKEPLTTVPPNVLAALPTLPEGLEYRFVHQALILLDARANLIVDFIRNALPSA